MSSTFQVLSRTTVQKHQFFDAQPSLWSSSHIRTGRTIALTMRTFVSKVLSLLFNSLSRLVMLVPNQRVEQRQEHPDAQFFTLSGPELRTSQAASC